MFPRFGVFSGSLSSLVDGFIRGRDHRTTHFHHGFASGDVWRSLNKVKSSFVIIRNTWNIRTRINLFQDRKMIQESVGSNQTYWWLNVGDFNVGNGDFGDIRTVINVVQKIRAVKVNKLMFPKVTICPNGMHSIKKLTKEYKD